MLPNTLYLIPRIKRLYPPLRDGLALPAERPVDLENLGHVRRQAGAVRNEYAQFLHL